LAGACKDAQGVAGGGAKEYGWFGQIGVGEASHRPSRVGECLFIERDPGGTEARLGELVEVIDP